MDLQRSQIDCKQGVGGCAPMQGFHPWPLQILKIIAVKFTGLQAANRILALEFK
jgi:hypothetical protein